MANRKNLANSVLFNPIGTSDTTLNVYTGDGTLFPSTPFYITLTPKNKLSRMMNSEIMLVTNVSGDTLTVTRAQRGTTAKSFDYGDIVANGIYKEDLDDLQLSILQAMMPVGFVVTLGVSTNPATLYGFGTWAKIEGKVVVGISATDTEFDTLDETGGAKTHTLTTSEMPSHDHSTFKSVWFPSGTGSLDINDRNGDGIMVTDNAAGGSGEFYGNDRTMINNEGGGGAHNNLQPYIVKYIWQRTA